MLKGSESKMKRTKEDLFKSLKTLIGERDDTEYLAFCDDLADSVVDENEDWKTKYEENDKAWRQRYRDRFEQPVTKQEEVNAPESEKEVKTFDDLFTQGN